MNPDDYITGTFDDNAPFNQNETEPLSELEEQQQWNAELFAKNVKMRYHLNKLAQFEESIRTFGFLSYKEQTEKNEILKQYL